LELTERLRELADLKAAKHEAKKAAEAAEQAYRELEDHVHGQLSEVDIPSIKHSGRTFSRNSTVYATITDFEAFERWCRDHDLLEEFIKLEEQRARLNELVRDHLDNKQDLPPGVGYRVRNYISITEN
jgi:hypothetical protein